MSRPHDRPAKDLILQLLAEHGPSCAGRLGILTKTGARCVRAHLHTMRRFGEVVTVDGTKPVKYCLASEEFVHNEPQADTDDFYQPVRKGIVPAGAWKLDHAIGVRSVFEMGVVAS